MATELSTALAPVCGRMKLQTALNLAVRGLATGAAVAFVLAMCRVSVTGWWPTIAALAALVLFPLGGLVLGLVSRSDWRGAARAVDERYRLDDRTTTAVAASQQSNTSPMAQLLLRETLDRLKQVKPGEVAPLRLPRGIAGVLLLAVLAGCLALLPLDPAAYFPGAETTASGTTAAGQPSALARPSDIPPAEVLEASRRVTRHNPLPSAAHDEHSPRAMLRQTIVERYFGGVRSTPTSDEQP
jgi:hypothetical protein